MFGFNWIDLIIFLILVNAVYNGIRIGFITLLLCFSGFFIGLIIAGWLFPHLLPIPDKTMLALVNGNLVLASAAIVAIAGFEFGERLHLSISSGKLHVVESTAGLLLSISSTLIIIWLLAAGVGSLPFAGFSNSANGSFVVQKLNRTLPPVPTVLQEFAPLINPNTNVAVYTKLSSNSSVTVAPVPASIPNQIIKNGDSVVRITGFGCGGIVDGSGFAVAKNLIATNAHVIAGVKRPIIKFNNSSYSAVPVLFDPNQDIALLKVTGLTLRPLTISSIPQTNNSIVYSEGFPQSIYTITPGIILNTTPTIGTNIYGLGSITRDTYVIKIRLNIGSSGGPIITTDGSVTGIIFAKDIENPNIAYGLTPQILLKDISRVSQSTRRVGTGACYNK